MDKHFEWLWSQLEKAATVAEKNRESHELVAVVSTGVVLAKEEITWQQIKEHQARRAAEREEEAQLLSNGGTPLGVDDAAK